MDTLITVAGILTDIPAPTPDWGGPGLGGLLKIVGWVFAIVLVLCVLGGIIAGGAIAVGRATSNGQVQDMGFKGVIGAVIGVVVCAVIVVVLNFVFNAFS